MVILLTFSLLKWYTIRSKDANVYHAALLVTKLKLIDRRLKIISLKIALTLIKGVKRSSGVLTTAAYRLADFFKPLLALVVNLIILQPYRLVLRLNRRLKNFWSKLPTLKLLSHHQSILYLLIISALSVTINSWRIHHTSADNFGESNLLFPLITPEFELVETESGPDIIPELPASTEGSSEAGTTGVPSQIKPSGSGATILKPHLVTSSPGTATRTAIEYYVVASGDTLSSIAERFGLNVNTLLWENRLSSWSIIRPGQKLTILPTDGVTYRVGRGDTVAKIASRYKISADSILAYNNISNSTLSIGQTIIIPGGKPPAAPATVARTTTVTPISSPTSSYTRLLWPTSAKRITQYYTWRHGGVDIAGPTGTAIYAAEEGIVEVSGWNKGGYGYYIIVDHGGGLKTLYAHASKLHVAAGDRVERGQHIANIGSTGRSTGPHLHFEVRVRGARTNPLNYIR